MAVGLGLLLGGLTAELVVRWSGRAPEVSLIREGRFRLSANPRIGYEPIPHYDPAGDDTDFGDFPGPGNGLGFRDVEHPVRKPEGTYRILILGDSVANGQGVPRREDIFPFRLRARLEELRLRTEVLSFAVSGYNTQQEVETLREKGLSFRPDLLLLAYCLNDVKRSDGGILPVLRERERTAAGVVSARAHPILVHSALYRLLRYGLLAEEERDLPPGIQGDTVAESFELLEELSRDNELEVLVVVFPRFGRWKEYRWLDHHERVAALSEKHGFGHLDLYEPFRACRESAESRLALDRYHPSPLGHECAAEAVADHLFRQQDALRIPRGPTP